jgi:hypothetical protein
VAALAGPVWLPTQGVFAGLTYQAYDSDLLAEAHHVQAADLWVSVFPLAHFETQLLARAQRAAGGARSMLALLQVHYYL